MKETNIDWVKNQSQTIDLLRFPMAICVIFIHMMPQAVRISDADFSLLSSHGIYNWLCIMCSDVFPNIAVPTFFVISGYLFFANFRTWSWPRYKDKLRSRVKTLLIPYIIWNIIPVIMDILRYAKYAVCDGKGWDGLWLYIDQISLNIFIANVYQETGTNLFGYSTWLDYPINVPLWFLRNLIVACIFTPVLYYLIKKMKIWMVFLLGLCFLLHIMIPIPGFDFKTFFFFSIGAYFAIEGKNIAEYARRFNYFYIPAAIILLIACTMLQDKYLMGIYIICGVFASFALCSFLIEKYKIKPIAVLVNSCFFVYAFHPIRIFILETPRTVCHKVLERFIIGNSTYIQLSISYLLTPFLTAAMCVGIYYLLKRFAPKLTAVLTGNR